MRVCVCVRMCSQIPHEKILLKMAKRYSLLLNRPKMINNKM